MFCSFKKLTFVFRLQEVFVFLLLYNLFRIKYIEFSDICIFGEKNELVYLKKRMNSIKELTLYLIPRAKLIKKLARYFQKNCLSKWGVLLLQDDLQITSFQILKQTHISNIPITDLGLKCRFSKQKIKLKWALTYHTHFNKTAIK